MTEKSERPRKKRTNPVLLIALAVIAVGAFALGYYLVQVRNPLAANQELNTELVTQTVGLKDAKPLKLDEKFKDEDHDDVADPPKNPAELLDPPKLVFTYVVTEDPERYKAAFEAFVAHVSRVTGKPVEYAVYRSPGQELRAMREGNLHIACFNTGNVPLAVNWAGFVPMCRFASPDGISVYQMEIIVPPDSPIQSMKDLKGHDVTLTEAGSNSGFKAPLVLLTKDDDGPHLQPVRDFNIRYSGGPEASLKGIASKEYEAAAIANDVLNLALASDTPIVQKNQYRSIYKSKDFPTAAFGYVYNLKPELAAKIKEAFFSFKWDGSKLQKEFAASGQSKFVPVEYKKDWALVIRIDNDIRSTQNLEALVESSESTTEPATEPAVLSTQPTTNRAKHTER